MTTKEKARLAVLIEPIKLDRTYGAESQGWELSIVAIDPKDEKPRNISRDSYENHETDIFDDLGIRCHFSWFDGRFVATSFYTEYRQVYSIDLRVLETLTKGLKKVAKIVASFPIQPESFGQYVCLLAAGFGVKECVRKYGGLGNRCSSYYLDHTWQVLPISSAQRIIDEELDRVKAIVCPVADVQAVA